MALREIGATLTLDGEAAFKKDLAAAQREVSNLNSELRLSQAEFDGQANSVDALRKKLELLKQKQEQQTEITEKLAKAVEDASNEFGDADKRTDALRRQYNNARASLLKLNNEIDDNEQYLSEAETAADGCASSIDGYGKKVKQAAEQTKPAEKNSGLLESALGKLNLTGLTTAAVLGKMVSGIKSAIENMSQMIDETAQLRTSLAKLEVSADNAGVAVASDLRGMLVELSGIGVEFDEGMETLTNLFAAGITDGERLAATVGAIEGAVIKYQQTIKAESLADSLQETLATGELTGQFSELLGREGLLDEYTASLAECRDYTERLNLTSATLAASGLNEVSEAFADANKAIVAYNEAQSRLELAQADYAAIFAPMKAAWTEFKAYMTEGWTDLMLHGFGGGTILTVLANNAGTTFNELETYLRTNQMSWVEWKQAVADSGMSAAEYWTHLQTSAATAQAATDATAAYAAAVEAQVPSVEEALEALDELQAEYDAIRASVDSAVSGFNNMSEATKNYETTADDMIEALKSQREYLAEYRTNLQTVADMGLSDELVAELSDGSAQSAAYLQAIVDGGAGAIDELNAEFAGVQAGKDAFVEKVSQLQPEFQAQLDDITSTLNDAVDDWNMYDEAATSGENTIQGLTTALAGKTQTVMNLGRQIGEAFMSGYNEALGINSPSREMAKAMDFTVAGALNEGQRRMDDLRATGAAMGRAILDGYGGSSLSGTSNAGGGSRVEMNIYPQTLDNATVDYLVRRVDSYLGGNA